MLVPLARLAAADWPSSPSTLSSASVRSAMPSDASGSVAISPLFYAYVHDAKMVSIWVKFLKSALTCALNYIYHIS